MTFLKYYLLALVIFFALDMVWLGWLARGFYRRHLGQWLTPQVDWAAAIIFYLLFIGGLVFFVILPANANGPNLQQAILHGAFFGLITYATYELTNRATIATWPLIVVAVDLAWGAFLCAAISGLTTWIGAKL